MNKKIQHLLIAFALISPNISLGQTFSLGTAENFILFTGNGGVSCTGSETLTGDLGSDLGDTIGFATSTIIGSVFTVDSITEQAAVDVYIAYNQLISVPGTIGSHPAAFGAGETLTNGVYDIAGAGSLGGSLTLDGGGDTNAVFIFRFTGAFVVGAAANLILTNDARPCNVYWVSEGAATIAAASTVKGTIIVNNAAIAVAANVDFEGHLLTTSGAISVNDASVFYVPNCISSTISIPLPPTTCNPDYGTTDAFCLFTSNGALSNSGASNITGHVGSHVGAVSGFGAATLIGNQYNADLVTAQVSIDLSALYASLMSVPITNTHAPVLGSETLYPGVYYITGAGSLIGTLTLDALADPGAVFIIRYSGAFSAAAISNIVLVNGTASCNVFFVVEGAISIGTGSNIKGTFISNNGAVFIDVLSTLEGKLFSTTGAISYSLSVTDGTVVCDSSNECPNSTLPVELTSFTAKCSGQGVELEWSTATEINNDYFSIYRTRDGNEWEDIARIDGAGNSTSIKKYSFTDNEPYNSLTYYKLQQTDINGALKDYTAISQDICQGNESEVSIYPNPCNETLNMSFSGDQNKIISTSIYNLIGERVYYSENYESKIALGRKFNGMYILAVTLASETIIDKFIVID
ncbi:MAG: hypothetical protein ACJA1C_001807 [Crocinitomicaceae bacterium]|jgi:hypothetical protein